MCGIFGLIDKKHQLSESKKAEIGVRMASILAYRGPDGQGLFHEGNILIGHVRLSIIDLSPSGSQPMTDISKRYQIVYNGEVFNYLELREELKSQYDFRTNTDTEVLLAAYLVWGKSCLEKLNGMFAFAILDTNDGTIFAARDRFGIKPFYYYDDEDFFVFASEITPILGFKKDWEVNDRVVANYLILNRVCYNEETFFTNIFRLKSSHALEIENGNIRIYRWYDLSMTNSNGFLKKEDFTELFNEAIELTLRSDVPVGISLSGGLDSGSILSTIVQKGYLNSMNSYSAVYDEVGRFNEKSNIQVYDSEIIKKNYTYPTLENYLTNLDDYTKCFVEPTPDLSTYAQFCVYSSVKNKNKVLLDGQGADESLAGYLYFFGLYFKELMFRFKWIQLIKEIAYYCVNKRTSEAIKYFILYLVPKPLKLILFKMKFRLVKKQSYTLLNSGVISDLYNPRTLSEGLISHFEHKFEHQLIWGDRSAMWFGIEVRYPFLDHRLIERLIRTKPESLLKNGVTKVLLREAMCGIVPDLVRLDKRKIGYETPGQNWIKTPEFLHYFKSIVDNNKFLENYVNTEMLIKRTERGSIGESELIKFLHLAKWKQIFIDNNTFYYFK